MVAWVVINRQRTRQSPPSFFPRSHSHFGSHPSLISEKTTPFVSYTYVEPILQPFCFQILACNGGSVLPSGSRLPIAYPLSSTCPEQSRGIPFLFTLLRTLLHFFAPTKNSTLLFSIDSALFAQNTRGGGGDPLLTSYPSSQRTVPAPTKSGFLSVKLSDSVNSMLSVSSALTPVLSFIVQLPTINVQSSQLLSLSECAVPKNVPITPLECAVPKTRHFKPFRMRSSEKSGGGGANC